MCVSCEEKEICGPCKQTWPSGLRRHLAKVFSNGSARSNRAVCELFLQSIHDLTCLLVLKY